MYYEQQIPRKLLRVAREDQTGGEKFPRARSCPPGGEATGEAKKNRHGLASYFRDACIPVALITRNIFLLNRARGTRKLRSTWYIIFFTQEILYSYSVEVSNLPAKNAYIYKRKTGFVLLFFAASRTAVQQIGRALQAPTYNLELPHTQDTTTVCLCDELTNHGIQKGRHQVFNSDGPQSYQGHPTTLLKHLLDRLDGLRHPDVSTGWSQQSKMMRCMSCKHVPGNNYWCGGTYSCTLHAQVSGGGVRRSL